MTEGASIDATTQITITSNTARRYIIEAISTSITVHTLHICPTVTLACCGVANRAE